jgi:hypothetical protein
MADVKVLQTLQYRAPFEAEQYLRSKASTFVGKDKMTGAPVFKTAAGVFIRASGSGTVLEVLSACSC